VTMMVSGPSMRKSSSGVMVRFVRLEPAAMVTVS
jgi:hypothetical protein